MKRSSFIRSNIIVTVLSLVQAAVTMLSQVLIAYYFGARAERDAYFSAMTIPAYIVTLFVGSLSSIFLPFLIDFKKKYDDEEVKKFISNTFAFCFLALAAVAIACCIFSEPILSITSPGFDGEQFRMANDLFDILIFTIVFQSLSSLVGSLYHAESRFFWPAVGPVLIPICAMIFVAIGNKNGIQSLAVGTLVGSVLNLLVLLPAVIKRISVRLVFTATGNHTWQVLRMAFPLLVSGAVFRLTTISERIIASTLPSGSISYLGYGNQIYVLLSTIASGSIAATFYPLLAHAWADKNVLEFRNDLIKGIRLILLITFPIATAFIVLGAPIIEILFERGAFDSKTTMAVADVIALMMGAFVFVSIGNLLTKAFYITNRVFIFSIISVFEVMVYIGVGFVLSQRYSFLGLAFASTVSTGFSILVCGIFLWRWGLLQMSIAAVDVFKLLMGAIVCGIVLWRADLLLRDLPVFVSTAISLLLGFSCYIAFILYGLKISDAEPIKKAIKSYF